MALTQKIKSFSERIHSILFPKRCAGCGAKETYLCDLCRNQIPLSRGYSEYTILSAVPYRQPAVQKLIWLLKYRGIKEVADIFAGWLSEILLDELTEATAYRETGGKILLVPIPLSKKRERARGYNQAEEIAKKLQELDPKLFRLEARNLIKIKDTPAQVKVKNRTERLNNLLGVFRVQNRRAFRGRTIILIDDVSTTGTTLAEASRALERAKPRKIIRVAVAS